MKPGKSLFEGRKHRADTIARIKEANRGSFPQRSHPSPNRAVRQPTRPDIRAEVLIDPQDYRLLDEYCFFIENGYVRTTKFGKRTSLHQLIMPGEAMIDHINGNPLDNRRCNLRPTTGTFNQQNRKVGQKNNTSGYKGVSWHKQKHKYCASIRINKKLKYLGAFSELGHAALAYNEAAKEFFGVHARLNKVVI